MIKKVVLGIVEGGFIGGIVGAALSHLHVLWGPFIAYPAVAAVGALVGAIAGRPIWAREAKLEAMLKSIAGAFIGAVALYGARKWLAGVHVDLGALGAGTGAIGDVPAAVLLIIGASLGFVFEVDDALGSEDKGSALRVAGPSRDKARVDVNGDEEEHSEHRARHQG